MNAGLLSVLRRYVPIVGWLPGYDRGRLAGDAVAGLTVWALLVPQSLAYATLAGVPVQYGLYAAFAGLLLYPVFGTSRQLVQGPSASVAAVSAAAITPLAGASALGTTKAVGYTAALALTTGAIYVALGLLRMGWVSTFLSRAVMSGFVLGFATGIVVDQSHKLLGVNVPNDTSYAQQLWDTLKEIPHASFATVVVGCASLALLLVMRAVAPRWPRMLVVVAIAIAVSSALGLADHGVAITGEVPTGLFTVGLPGVGFSDTTALVVGALSVIFVGYSESLAAGRAMARKHGYELDTNQELVAQGAACLGAGLVGAFATDGSLSKTTVADVAGQRSQVASLIDAGLVLLTLVLFAGLFETLPAATLGAVVIDAMLGLITLRAFKRYYAVNRADWVFFMGAALGILFFGITQGILIGVVLSLLLLIWHASRTSIRELRRDPGSGAFHDASRHAGLEAVPGTVIVRIDGPLFFADADRFRTRVQQLAHAAPTLEHLVVDAEAVHLSDTDGADILLQVAHELWTSGIRMSLVGMHPPVRALWQRAGVFDTREPIAVCETVAEAVAAYDRRSRATA
jgi:high affinity sulfate transporter 1